MPNLSASAREIPVPFEGKGSGVCAMTWGQQAIWDTIARTGRTLNIGGVMAMPEGTPVEEIAGVLRFAMSRHQSLRARLRLDDIDDRGLPRQQVFESGQTALVVLDVSDADDPATAAEELRMRYEMTPFDYEHEWPVRMAVVCRGGKVSHLVVQYCHLAVDGGGIDALIRDLEHLDPETGAATAPVQGAELLTLAESQASASGRRRSDKALRFWEKGLRSIPAQRFNGSDDPREDRFWEMYCYSPAMFLALQSIAARTKAETTHVALAAFAVSLARVTGRSPSVTQVLVNNRFRPDFADAVMQVSQSGLCVVDVADCTFDEVVGRAWKAATAAYLHGYFDETARTRLFDQVDEERGEHVDVSCFVNDRRGQSGPQPGDPLPTPEELAAALHRTRMRWDRRMPMYDTTMFLHLDAAPDANVPGRTDPHESELPAVYFQLWADTHKIAPADIERFARGLEGVLVEAAFDGTVPTRVAAMG
ncbi:condensation domain protein [Catenulispora acidiphila DSM 44928]|uniref:Condensation domain protein n=1 Tax=Catenulispora acidiphila (strain DSM 44928 / JCM 14897 / NBRC 102108 / NRRL B-24433 / ID139908) TaxID=479433 RepID=C7Q1K2_CATAD|nr:condensation domain-containing protein [Catenulispora acidiphila]ACU73731.1 condensation domain protein [Catenulispora acidiphila DSM 44928]